MRLARRRRFLQPCAPWNARTPPLRDSIFPAHRRGQSPATPSSRRRGIAFHGGGKAHGGEFAPATNRRRSSLAQPGARDSALRVRPKRRPPNNGAREPTETDGAAKRPVVAKPPSRRTPTQRHSSKSTRITLIHFDRFDPDPEYPGSDMKSVCAFVPLCRQVLCLSKGEPNPFGFTLITLIHLDSL
jgi:hypothetical protein